LDVEEPGRTVIWPRGGALPDNDEAKAEYFDQLYHADAVVGINTSALVEASILRKPILTLDDTRFPAQSGTLHFGYIAYDEERGTGVVRTARSWSQHLDHLAAAVRGDTEHVARCDRFVSDFIRPLGRDVAGAPVAVDVVEKAATDIVTPTRPPLLAPILVLLTPVVWLLAKMLRPRRTWHTIERAYRRRQKARARAKKVGAKLKSATTSGARNEQRHRDRAERRRQDRTAGKPPKAAGVRVDTTDRAALGAPVEKPTKDEAALQRKQARRELKAQGERASEGSGASAAAKVAPKSKPSKKRPLSVRVRRGIGRARKRGRRQWKVLRHATYSFYNRRHRGSYATSITKLPSRDELPALLNAMGLLGTGAEIGVKQAVFSDYILKHWKGARFISIDPWLSVDWEEYIDRSNVTQEEFDENFDLAKQRLAKYGSRSEIWRLTSVEAAERVPPGSMDFVYIDARHDYESVKEDLHAWFDKVRPGGVLAGHDYADGILVQGDFGVKSAVDEFFAERGIPVHITNGPSPVEMFPSWVVVIPETDS
jgi:hypothetical protein